LRPPSARLIIIVVFVVRRPSTGRRILPAQLGIGAVKRAMLAIEIHRYPAVAGTLDVHGKTTGSTLSPVTKT
jgi:hypothetical protein